MDYEEAPSGFVTLYNYKEPFMKYESGFGFQGLLLFDGKTKKLQCHECGEWFHYLPDHLHREHNMTASAYKERVGLRQSTVLISEDTRHKLVAVGLERRLQNLIPGGLKTEEMKEKIKATCLKRTREMENEHGTCPEQLLQRLNAEYEKYGRMPKQEESKNLFKTIRIV